MTPKEVREFCWCDGNEKDGESCPACRAAAALEAKDAEIASLKEDARGERVPESKE